MLEIIEGKGINKTYFINEVSLITDGKEEVVHFQELHYAYMNIPPLRGKLGIAI